MVGHHKSIVVKVLQSILVDLSQLYVMKYSEESRKQVLYLVMHPQKERKMTNNCFYYCNSHLVMFFFFGRVYNSRVLKYLVMFLVVISAVPIARYVADIAQGKVKRGEQSLCQVN